MTMPSSAQRTRAPGQTSSARRAHVHASVVVAALGGAIGLGGAAAIASASCAGDARVVEACFDVHGRLRIDANLRMHLWPIGTRRLLAVHYRRDAPEPDPPLPGNVAKALGLDNELFGDFRICPFTPDRPGRMRIVCIDEASNLSVRPLKPAE